jgi:glutathione S-transferase
MTITDLVAEVHDTHHPVASALYYEDQQAEAARRAEDLRSNRLPKFLGYFEDVLEQGGGQHLLRQHSYVDLSLFQVMSGLEYMFPKRMSTLAPTLPLLQGLRGRVAQRPNIAAYLESERRVAFNTNGIFRHYPELDAA